MGLAYFINRATSRLAPRADGMEGGDCDGYGRLEAVLAFMLPSPVATQLLPSLPCELLPKLVREIVAPP